MNVVMCELPRLAEECKKTASASQVVKTDEMLKVLTGLGVRLDRPYRKVIIELDFQSDFVKVYLEQLGMTR